MKQLLIVNSAKALKTGVADDLTVLDEGQIGFFHLSPDASGANEGKVTFFNTKPTNNFGIALGRGANVPAFVIPPISNHLSEFWNHITNGFKSTYINERKAYLRV